MNKHGNKASLKVRMFPKLLCQASEYGSPITTRLSVIINHIKVKQGSSPIIKINEGKVGLLNWLTLNVKMMSNK